METSAIDPMAKARSSSDVLTVLRDDGSADPARDPRLDAARLRAIYFGMARARALDGRLAELASEGTVHVHVPSRGLEAAVVGTVTALRDSDWLFPSGRDLGAFLHRGVELETILHQALGTALDTARGRRLPGHATSRAFRIASAGGLRAQHLSHAVGFAWAASIARQEIAVAALFDESAVPTADFHTAMNFAGVRRAPAVLVCRNRGSAPISRAGVAYGVAARRADGTDVLAVIAAVREARERARAGIGPTFVELVLSKGAHVDPIDRFRSHAESRGALDSAEAARIDEEIARELDAAVTAARAAAEPSVAGIFDDVYGATPPELRMQRDDAVRFAERRRET